MTSVSGKLVLIVGPSGSGKGTVIAELKKRHSDFVYPVSCTTRSPRPGEVPGDVYDYVSKEEFTRWVSEGKFLEWAEVHKDNFYGVLKEPVMKALEEGKVVIREVDIQGFRSISEIIPREHLLSIFILVTDLEELRRRILGRGPLPEDEITRRLESAKKEIASADLCDYRIESRHGEIERMVDEATVIIEKARKK